jgi:hypothetical protein
MRAPPTILSNLPPEILSKFFNLLADIPLRKSFCNFWIACTCDTEYLHKKTNQALYTIELSLGIVKTINSNLIKYVTTCSTSELTKHIVNSIIIYLEHIYEAQKEKPRLRTISLFSPLREGYHIPTRKLFEIITKFENLQTLRLDPNIQVNISWLKKFFLNKNLKSITATIIDDLRDLKYLKNETSAQTENFQSVLSLEINHNLNFVNWFPNLVFLLLNVDCKACWSRINPGQIPILDLSSLKFLELLFLVADYKESSYLDVIVSGENLKNFSVPYLTKIMQPKEILKAKSTYPKLQKIKLQSSNCFDIQETFRTADLFDATPYLNFIAFDNCYLTRKMMQSLSKFVNINSLSIRDCRTSNDCDFGLISKLNLTKVYAFDLCLDNKSQVDSLKVLCSNAKHLLWHVSYALENLIEYPAPHITPNLIYLDAPMTSLEWMNMLPSLVKIPSLRLSSTTIKERIDNEIFKTNDLLVDDSLLNKMEVHTIPINPNTFLAKFHMLRIKRIYELLNEPQLNPDNKICTSLHFAVDTKLQPVTSHILLEKHNIVLDNLFDHTLGCTCEHECHLYLHPKYKLDFKFGLASS